MVWGSNPSVSKIFCTSPDWPLDLHSLLYKECWVSLQRLQQPRRGIYRPPLSSAKVQERVELYLYSPSGSAWPVIGQTLPFKPYEAGIITANRVLFVLYYTKSFSKLTDQNTGPCIPGCFILTDGEQRIFNGLIT